jgi:hypothetical protein
MNFSTLVGSVGVTMLLLAFFLNLFKFINEQNKFYILLNITGAAMSAYASFLINYMPFVFLEVVWCFIALVALIKKMNLWGK